MGIRVVETEKGPRVQQQGNHLHLSDSSFRFRWGLGVGLWAMKRISDIWSVSVSMSEKYAYALSLLSFLSLVVLALGDDMI